MTSSINNNTAPLSVENETANDLAPADIDTSLANDESGATTLEFALLLACIAFPAYFILQAALGMLIDYYRMTMTLLALPLP